MSESHAGGDLKETKRDGRVARQRQKVEGRSPASEGDRPAVAGARGFR